MTDRTGQDHPITDAELKRFLESESASGRQQLLDQWQAAGKTMSFDLIRGLVKLQLAPSEIIKLVDLCVATSKPDFELWVMNHILDWEQNLASVALRAWSEITDRILWHRLLPLTALTNLPQRIRFTILDIAPVVHGYEITKAMVNSPIWEDFHPAFHALLIERALQFNVPSTRLTKLCWSIINDCQKIPHPEQKSLLPAIVWLCKYDEKEFIKKSQLNHHHLWQKAAQTMIDNHVSRQSTINKMTKLLDKGAPDILQKMPYPWSRFDFTPTHVSQIVSHLDGSLELLYGIPTATIVSGLELALAGGNLRSSWSDVLLSMMPFDDAHLGQLAQGASAFSQSYRKDLFPDLSAARLHGIQGKLSLTGDKITDVSQFAQGPTTAMDSKNHHSHLHRSAAHFFATLSGKTSEAVRFATRDSSESHPESHSESHPAIGIWDQFAGAIQDPTHTNLQTLSSEARKYKGIASLAFIAVLAKQKGKDEAVLKLLDYVRSNDEDELRGVVHALGQIDTPRSLMELIAMITRPNATIAIQQEIVLTLAGKNLSELQNELRSAVIDLKLPPNTEHPLYQIKDELSSMIAPTTDDRTTTQNNVHLEPVGADLNLDRELGDMIPHFKHLSSEVKRALRTALFFNKTAVGSHHANAIDLSPLIDMQYKAMELLYREFFEDAVTQSLQRGGIQRKLDVIGYARPIPRSMDEFENFVAALPVVREIPFFSKFKLRKMLRAICQFEPGRRFTLDGLKAFGLYFLIFGRKSCKYGLAQSFEVGAKDDLELAELCKELHIFQDFRNRAAHEGFHPDASNDVIGIWRTTALVVQWAFKIKEAQAHHTNKDAQKNDNRHPNRQAS